MGTISSYGKIEEKGGAGVDEVERGGLLKQVGPNQNVCGRLTVN